MPYEWLNFSSLIIILLLLFVSRITYRYPPLLCSHRQVAQCPMLKTSLHSRSK